MTVLVTPNIADAIERANHWIITARPIIVAYYALDAIDADLICDCDERTRNDARQPVERCMSKLLDLVEDIRSEAIADQWLHASDNADEAEWDAVEEHNDALQAAVPTVAWALKHVEAA